MTIQHNSGQFKFTWYRWGLKGRKECPVPNSSESCSALVPYFVPQCPTYYPPPPLPPTSSTVFASTLMVAVLLINLLTWYGEMKTRMRGPFREEDALVAIFSVKLFGVNSLCYGIKMRMMTSRSEDGTSLWKAIGDNSQCWKSHHSWAATLCVKG